ncbi:uncharacterized protein LOC111390326 [Olea europaea var. sylvestris]|uniref:uncharacterized protein LOC111390326 n=1 Tax=Olea europaea var. sylvestris TaxID=158386 RepID=UPI000C1D51F9|nr:uncharacterized protein LOC111390326 [Olea europaea var. sylvestris]
MNEKITDYLADVRLEKWSRIHMPANRYSTMTLNIVESVNAVSPSNRSVFSVSDEKSTFVIDIEQRPCTLQVDLIPCPHALAVIANTRRDSYAYCSYYYTGDAYNEWTVPTEVQAKIVLALNQKRSSRRPTEKRKRSSREGKPTVKCGRCGGQGHKYCAVYHVTCVICETEDL